MNDCLSNYWEVMQNDVDRFTNIDRMPKGTRCRYNFRFPGGAVLNIYDALYKAKDEIRHILTSHEQGAAHAAD